MQVYNLELTNAATLYNSITAKPKNKNKNKELVLGFEKRTN